MGKKLRLNNKIKYIDKTDNEIYTVRIQFSCAPEHIVLVNAILDSYGGLGLIRTLNKKECKCAVFTTNTIYETTLSVLEALKNEGLSIYNIQVDRSECVDEFALKDSY